MGIARPTGQYAGRMLEPGGWPDANEDTFYDRAQEYNQMLRKVTEVLETCQRQRGEVFEGGIWSGGAANAANGALGTNINQMMTLQDYLATVITWHRHIGELIVQAKANIGNNVDGAHREIVVLENDANMDADERAAAIKSLIGATREANASLVIEAAEQVRASRNWKPPKNALADLLDQKAPPLPEIPTLVVPTPGTPPSPVTPTPSVPTPSVPTPSVPTPSVPAPEYPGTPVRPPTPGQPAAPVTPVDPAPGPVTPGAPVIPGTPVTPGRPVIPSRPSKPGEPDRPTPAEPATPVAPPPGPAPAPAPAPVPGPTPQPSPAPGQPSAPVDPGTPGAPSTPAGPGERPAPHVKPAAATEAPAAGGPAHQPGGPAAGTADDSAASAPAAATGMPATARGVAAAAPPAAGVKATSAGAGTGSPAASGAGSRAAAGRAPLGTSRRAEATPSTRAASARTAPPSRPQPPEHSDQPDKTDAADTVTPSPMVPVSATRAARDAAAAATRRAGKPDALRLARRIAAALNAPDVGDEGDFGFCWITAVTTDGAIVVANSYGLAYIPDGMELPDGIYLASADHAIPADEMARCATYPVLAVQGWAAFHDLKLRAVIGTAEQLANSDPGAAKIVLEPDDIPDSGKMIGRSRLEVVDPAAAARLTHTGDLRLTELLPPAPVAADPPDDERHMLWFELMKPMTSTATGRAGAHLRAFRAYAVHSQEIVLHQAHSATEPGSQRTAVADWLYWGYVVGLLDNALSEAT